MMKIAILAPIAWRTPPRHYGPWEWVASLLTEGLVKRGVEATLFATGDSQTAAELVWTAPRPYEEDKTLDPKVWECLHISRVFEEAERFDLIHNHFDFLPLTYSALVRTPVVTTIHGFSSPKILPVYQKYNGSTYYVSISQADRHPSLDYIATVYHGIPLENYPFQETPGDYLLFLGRIHRDKGTYEAIQLARSTGLPLLIAGIIQDQDYFDSQVAPHLDGEQIRYIGPVGPEAKGALLSRALALVHLINFDEPFGLSVVESMACGTPVIAVKRGSMAELSLDGKTGFLIDHPGQAADRVKELSQLDRRACREHVEKNFTVDKMVDGYLEVYRKILARQGAS
ncbi:MAG: glycosyltransferase family 4 protein [Dethiobacteria bacterium]